MVIYHVPALSYGYDDLEPFLDGASVRNHLLIHQQYADGLNGALEATGASSHPAHVSSIIADIGSVPEDARGPVGHFGGGYDNHCVFWDSVAPGGGDPGRLTADHADIYFGGVDAMVAEFSERAASIRGSGWCWLVLDMSYRKLSIISTANEASPRSMRLVPILGLDMWEHAYYMMYGPDRESYIRRWWKVANWRRVEDYLERAA